MPALSTAIAWDVTTGIMRQQFVGDGRAPVAVGRLAISPAGETIYAAIDQGRIMRWAWASPSPQELVRWIAENRHLRPLTCAERATCRLTPLCTEDGQVQPGRVADLLAIDLSPAGIPALPGPAPIPLPAGQIQAAPGDRRATAGKLATIMNLPCRRAVTSRPAGSSTISPSKR